MRPQKLCYVTNKNDTKIKCNAAFPFLWCVKMIRRKKHVKTMYIVSRQKIQTRATCTLTES